jgi:aspartate aminotransferase
MSFRLADRVARLVPSPTLAVSAKAKGMLAAGEPVISLAAGEPDLPTPSLVVEAAVQALRNGATCYTEVKGIPALRQAIAADGLRARGHRYDPDTEVLVTVGAKQALFNLFQALLNEGDEVLLPLPSWVSYAPQIELAGGCAVSVAASPEDGFFPSIESLEAARNECTRALVWASPSNPTGRVAEPEQVRAVAEWAAEHDILIISDEIYRRICFSDAPSCVSPLEFSSPQQVVIIDGVSKSHCMTGWRIGWAMGPAPLIAAMTKIQSHQTSNPTTVSQHAALAALKGCDAHVDELVASLELRRDRFCKRLAHIDGLRVLPPQGAFYVFVDLNAALLPGEDDLAFCDALLSDQAVAVVPGSAFGAPGWLRMSIALPLEDLMTAADRLQEFLEKRV